MSGPNDVTVESQCAAEEVELTAEDLRALSVGSTIEERSAASANPVSSVPGQAHPPERKAISRLGLPVVVVLAIAAAAAGHTFFAEHSEGHVSTATLPPPAAELQWAAPKGQDLVRFANPFDAAEVFEFPAGTTEAEAQEAVAGFLMERALNRQARLDGKLKRYR